MNAQVFWSRVARSEECWTWDRPSTNGYGYVKIAGRALTAHRYAWLLTHGDAPAELQVCHTCDNRACVRPAHLFLGTRTENARDARTKGRLAHQRLRTDDIADIRALRGAGLTMPEIGRRYGVTKQQVHNILSGRGWRGT